MVRHLNTAQNELTPCYQPERQRRGNIADVMAALGDFRAHCALSAGRTQPQQQARVARQTPQPANQHHWPKSAAKLATSRGKVGHFNAAAKAVEQAGEQNCGVGQVVLLNAFAVQPLNAKKAKVIWMQEGIVNNEAADKARAAGLQVVMNKCMLKEISKL